MLLNGFKKDFDRFFLKKRNVVFIAIFYTFLWGLCFPFVKLCMQEFDISESNFSKCLVAGVRFIISGSILCISMLINKKDNILPQKKELSSILGYGILATVLQYTFTYIGLSNVDGAKGAIFDQLSVFIIIILGGLLLRNDKLSPRKLIGAALGFVGVLAVGTEKMSLKFAIEGEGMMTFAAICQAGAYFIATLSANKVSAAKLVGYGQLFGGIILTAFSLIAGGRITKFSVDGLILLLSLALFSAVAYVLSIIPLKYFPASEISVFNLLITVFGVILSGLLLGENIFKINYLISLALISMGIILVNTTKDSRNRHSRKTL